MQTLILDSKPRFRGEYELDGVSTRASRRYKKWAKEYGTLIPGSYVLPLKNFKAELDQVWRLGGRIAIAQGDMDNWKSLIGACQAFYQGSYGKHERLVVVNELADFYQVSRTSNIFWLISRSGREKKVGLIAESQRPRYIPVPVLTEMKQVFLFELDNKDDMKHMFDMGVPKERPGGSPVQAVDRKYVFFYWNKELKWKAPSGEYHIVKRGM